MSTKGLALLLVGLVVAASARTYDDELDKNAALVQQLDQWLVDNVNAKNDPSWTPAQNADETRRAQEEQPELKPVADALFRISRAKDCDASVLDAVRVLYPVSTLDTGRRVDYVARYFLRKLPTKACLDALESQYKQVADLEDPKVAELVKVLASDARELLDRAQDSDFHLTNYLSAGGPEEGVSERDVHMFKLRTASDVRTLAKDDPQAKIFEEVEDEKSGHMLHKLHPENNKYAFKTYLLKPCQQFMGKTEKIFETFFSVAKHLPNPTYSSEYKDQVKYRAHVTGIGRNVKAEKVVDYFATSYYTSKEFQDGVAAYKRCRLLEKYDDETVNMAFSNAAFKF